MPKVTYTVTLTVPKNVRDKDVRKYIRDALTVWGGSLRPAGSYDDDDPGDPMFGFKKVTNIQRIYAQDKEEEL